MTPSARAAPMASCLSAERRAMRRAGGRRGVQGVPRDLDPAIHAGLRNLAGDQHRRRIRSVLPYFESVHAADRSHSPHWRHGLRMAG
eukprot:scaffold1940_cov312-Prasinococcus_capsulatus_cf.AAC.5